MPRRQLPRSRRLQNVRRGSTGNIVNYRLLMADNVTDTGVCMNRQICFSKTAVVREHVLNASLGVPVTAALVLILQLAATPLPARAAPADDYTREIMAEGSKLETLGQAQREREALEKTIAKQRASAPKKTEPAKAPAAVTSSSEDFERELRQAFPASFALYSILGSEDKAQVRATYDKSAPVGAARFHPVVSKIISLSIKKR